MRWYHAQYFSSQICWGLFDCSRLVFLYGRSCINWLEVCGAGMNPLSPKRTPFGCEWTPDHRKVNPLRIFLPKYAPRYKKGGCLLASSLFGTRKGLEEWNAAQMSAAADGLRSANLSLRKEQMQTSPWPCTKTFKPEPFTDWWDVRVCCFLKCYKYIVQFIYFKVYAQWPDTRHCVSLPFATKSFRIRLAVAAETLQSLWTSAFII